MKIKPIGERVLIMPIKEEEKTASGIILPGASDKEKPNLGTVIAVGKGDNLKDVKKGQTIVYNKYAGTEIKSNEEKYIILNGEDVLAVVE